MFVDNQTIS